MVEHKFVVLITFSKNIGLWRPHICKCYHSQLLAFSDPTKSLDEEYGLSLY